MLLVAQVGWDMRLLLSWQEMDFIPSMRKVEGGGSKQIIDIVKNENLPLQVIQLDVKWVEFYSLLRLCR
ncbi:MAG: hypothetical protein WA364_14920 [Candidatus Nitrosopolaris sp.]